MTHPLRIAFVGVDHPHGAGWRDLLANFTSDIVIAAVVPGPDGSLCSLEERFAHLPRFASVTKLIEWGQFDAAIVCLPNDMGPPAIVDLARAGKHILAEKPVAGCAADFACVVQAVHEYHVAYQHGYMWRYDQAAVRLRDMVRDGRFGRLINVEMTFVTSDVQRRIPAHYLFDPTISQAGFFNWLGCHYLDLLLFVTGQQVVGVTARVGVFGSVPVEVEDGGAVILELEQGTLVSFVGGYWLPRWAGQCRWCLRGSERWVEWDPARPRTGGVLEIHGPKPQWYAMEETFSLPPDTTPGYGGSSGVALVQDWIDAARGADNACKTAVESSHSTLELLDAIYTSSRSERRVACSIG